MNILVTGGAGFIGSHVVNAYLQENHRVVVVDNLSTGEKRFLNPKAVFYEADILDAEVGEIIKKENIHIINHHAAQISVSESVADPIFDAKVNIIGTLQLVQNAVSYGVKKFIFASTGGAIYGEQEVFPASEDHPCRPCSPYGISKLSVEHYLRFYEESAGLKTVVLRYSNVFGPHQNPHGEAGVVAIFCNRLNKTQSPVIFGDGEQTRDFIFVGDVARANVAVLDPACTGTFNIGTGKEWTINAVTRSLVRLSNRQVPIQYGPPRNGEQRRSCIDNKKFCESFDWKPHVSLEEGLVETIDYFRNNQG